MYETEELILEQTVSDFLFYENDDNIAAFKSYVDAVDKDSESVSQILEDHIFSRLDIYLEDNVLLFERKNEFYNRDELNKELKRRGEKITYDDQDKDSTLRKIRKNKVAKRSIGIGKADDYKGDAKKKDKKVKKEKTSAEKSDIQKRWNLRGAKRDRKAVVDAHAAKEGKPTLRKAIVKAAKKVWKKSAVRKKIVDAINPGVVAAKRKIDGARKSYKKVAAKYVDLKAEVLPDKKDKAARKKHWDKIEAQKALMLKHRSKYKNLRSRKAGFRRKMLRKI